MDFEPRDFDDSRDRNEDFRDRHDDRWPDRGRGHDPRNVSTRDLDKRANGCERSRFRTTQRVLPCAPR